MNYMNLNLYPVRLSFLKDRTHEFVDIYHAHQGMELLYVHEGHGQVIVNQRIFELSPGCLFYFRPFQLHRIHMKLDAESHYIRSLFVFEPTELDRYLVPFTFLRTFFHRLWRDPLEQQVFDGLPQQQILRLFENYRERIPQPASEFQLEGQLLFLMDFFHILMAHKQPERQKKPSHLRKSSAAERVMKWVEEHYMEEFKLECLAEEIHLSPNHLSAVFRQTVGTTITEYLTARRIRQACWLLKTSDLSVQEVGQAIGLTNFSYFCNLFKKHVGLSPYRFKRSNG